MMMDRLGNQRRAWRDHCGALALILAQAALAGFVAGCQTTRANNNDFNLPSDDGLFSPRGAPWTILCIEMRGPNHERAIGRIAETLGRTRGINPDNIVVRENVRDGSRIYYGTYYRVTDSGTGRRSIPDKLRKDLRLLKELTLGDQRRPFLQARTVRVPLPNVGPEEWRLANVTEKYSLQVAVFEPTDEFWNYKEAALEYCRQMRDRGYEAFFHHGTGASMVTVGRFGEDAITLPARGLPILNPKITKLQEDEMLKYNRLNGRVYTARSDSGQRVRVRSRLVEVPQPVPEDLPW
ncbi:MAG: hypothetical protein ACYTHJ_18645 [Planctomycetota bacterium]|jgi:hypothetical protein